MRTYFITAKGKAFYEQLMHKGDVAISGMTGGKGSMEKKAISIRGKVKNIGQELLDKAFIKVEISCLKICKYA